LAILENFLFFLFNGKLRITGSNLDTTIVTETGDLDIQETGSLAIKANILIDTLRDMPDQPLEFKHENDDHNISLHSSYGNYKIPCDPAEDYPEMPSAQSVDFSELSSHDLEEMINTTIFATSNDELRLAMNGIYLDFSTDQTYAVATDAHILVRYGLSNALHLSGEGIIIPKKAIKILKSLLGNAENIGFGFEESFVYFKIDSMTVISRLITQKYPNYQNVIPTQIESKMTIDRVDLLNSLKRTSNFANKTTNQVNFNIQEDQLQLMAKDMDFNSEAVETITCEYSDDPLEISFNSVFLIEMLNALDTEKIQFHLTSARTACLIFGLSEDHEPYEKVLMLIMPVAYN
jgi:DNA polymerase-3 subunit beta